MPTFDELRTRAFKAILSKAFKAMPRKIDEVFSVAGWSSFSDFMADVNRFGVEIRTEKSLPLDQANTEAMVDLLHEVFVLPEESVLRNLQSLDVATWGDLVKAVLAVAVEVYAADHRGRTPLDDAKEPTRKFFTMDPDNPEQVLEVVKTFGFPSPRHFEAVLHSVFSAELTPEDLDAALERPRLLEEMVNRAPSNPHKGITFWDWERKGGSMGARRKAGLAGPKQWFSVRALWPDLETGTWQPFLKEVAASDEAEAAQTFLRMYPGTEITDVVPSRGMPRGKLLVAGAALGRRYLVRGYSYDPYGASMVDLVDYMEADSPAEAERDFRALYRPANVTEVKEAPPLVAGASLGVSRRWFMVSALWPSEETGDWQPFSEEVIAENEAAAVEVVLRKYPGSQIEDVSPSGREARGKLLVAGPSMGAKMNRNVPHAMMRDLSYGSRPGCFVAVRWSDWTGGRPVIEGWRGPDKESEDFPRTQLEEAKECQGATILSDIAGFWDCIPPWVKVF